jgi:hypothetical protein
MASTAKNVNNVGVMFQYCRNTCTLSLLKHNNACLQAIFLELFEGLCNDGDYFSIVFPWFPFTCPDLMFILTLGIIILGLLEA